MTLSPSWTLWKDTMILLDVNVLLYAFAWIRAVPPSITVA
jgi:hypothetical protein